MEAGHPEGYHISLPRRSHVPLMQKTGDRDEAVKSGCRVENSTLVPLNSRTESNGRLDKIYLKTRRRNRGKGLCLLGLFT